MPACAHIARNMPSGLASTSSDSTTTGFFLHNWRNNGTFDSSKFPDFGLYLADGWPVKQHADRDDASYSMSHTPWHVVPIRSGTEQGSMSPQELLLELLRSCESLRLDLVPAPG